MKYQENKDCIEACLECASLCNLCAAACLNEEESEVGTLTDCIRLNLECAISCYAASEMLTYGSDRSADYCRLCAELCEACERECRKHNYDQCREASRACLKCAMECRDMILNSYVMNWAV